MTDSTSPTRKGLPVVEAEAEPRPVHYLGDPSLESLEPVSGSAFGTYELVRPLGKGRVAELFEAARSGPGGFKKRFAVKMIRPEYAGEPDFMEQFVAEARVAALLDHPNIVQVFDFGEENARPFLAMELVDGVSLRQLMQAAAAKGQPLGPSCAVAVGVALCEALGYVFDLRGPDGRPLKLVHRDVTPGNILVSRQGAVKLTDFGMVKSAMSSAGTWSGVVRGDCTYLSPEQVTGHPADHRSDLFSLGVVLYEVATMRQLFKRPDDAQVIEAVTRGEVPRPSTLMPFPKELERILLKLLAVEPAQRYQSPHEVHAELDALRQAEGWASSRELASLVEALCPVTAPADPIQTPPVVEPRPPLAPEPRKRRLGGVALGLATLAVLGALAWLLLRLR